MSRFVRNPFGANGPPGFDFSELGRRADTGAPVGQRAGPDPLAFAGTGGRGQAKRRIGVGLSGLGDALLMLRLDYGSPAARVFAARIARCIRDQAYLASAGLAAERGVFPAYAPRPYLEPRAGWPPCRPPCRPLSGGTASGTAIWFRSRPRAASASLRQLLDRHRAGPRVAASPPAAHRRGPAAQRGGAESRMAALAPVAWRWRRTAAPLPPRGRYRPIRAYRHAARCSPGWMPRFRRRCRCRPSARRQRSARCSCKPGAWE